MFSLLHGLFVPARGGGAARKQRRRRGGEAHATWQGVERLEPRLLLAADIVERLSIDTGDGDANGLSEHAMVSSTGRFVVFSSAASDLVANDTNGVADVFLLDRNDGSIELISVNSSGAQANAASFELAVTPDGQFVVFRSMATNLDGGVSGNGHVFLRDVDAGTTHLISSGAPGFGGDGGFDASISPNGRFVAFTSTVGANDQIFSFDRDSGLSSWVSFDDVGDVGGNGDSGSAVILNDGDVIFHSAASNLVGSDNNGRSDIFRWDSGTTAIQRLTPANSNGNSFNPSASDDGRFIVFESDASNLVGGDNNGNRDIFWLDTTGGGIQRVSVASGVQANNDSFDAAVSNNGRFIVFASSATNLFGGDTNGAVDIFLHDRQTGSVKPISLTEAQVTGNGASTRPDISGDGSFIVFQSVASNLVVNDGNGASDVFGVASDFQIATGVDLTAEIVTLKAPAALIGGQTAKGSIQVDVRNVGITPTDSGERVDVQVLLRPVGGGDDILLNTATNQSISNLGPGEAKRVNVSFTIPNTLTVGEYQFVVVVDPAGEVNGEIEPANNTVIAPQSLVVADPFVDLNVTISRDGLPLVMVPGDRGSLEVLIENFGNVQTAGTLNVIVYASTDENLDAGDLVIGESTQKINLRPSKGKKVKFNFKGFESNVPEGDYFLIVDVQPTEGDPLLLLDGRAIIVGGTTHEIVWGFGQVGDRNNVRMVLLDADNNPVTFQLSGSGTGNVALDGDAFDIVVTGADNSKVSLKGKRGSTLMVDDFSADGAVTLDAKTANVTGSVDINGDASSIAAMDLNGATFDINGLLKKLTANIVTNTQLNVTGEATSVQVGDWNGGGIMAAAMKSLTTKGVRNGPAGDFSGDITLTDAASDMTLTAKIKNVIRDSMIRSAGDIKGITAAAMVNSNVFAGIDPAVTGLPAILADFLTPATIGSLKLTGRSDEPFAFSGSNVAANTFGKVDINSVNPANADTPFGLATQNFSNIAFILNGENQTARNNDTSTLDLTLADDFEVRRIV